MKNGRISAEPNVLPLELTAPAMQRIARKGLAEPLTFAECTHLCECVLFHIEALLEQRRIPRIGDLDDTRRQGTHEP